MTRVLYRVRQFWRGLRATVTPADQQRVARALPPAASPLFTQMPVDAQRHSLNVLDSLGDAGKQPDLAVAALLHDCGKVALGLWLRGPLVLLEMFLPQLTARWAMSPPLTGIAGGAKLLQGWRYALYVQREHPAIGATWAAEAGCSPLSCWLIAHHQTPFAETVGSDEARKLLMALQRADEDN